MWMLILEGLAIGGLLGLTGAGGGILAVPALMASQGWTVAQAAPVGLLAVTLSALVGTFEGLFKKIVRYRAALWIALISIPSARYGVHLGGIISPVWLTLAFSLVMLVVAYRIFFKKVNDHTGVLCKVNQTTGRLIWNMKTALSLGAIGVVAGLLTGLLGVGGGFVIVPVLSKVTDLDMRSIVATSLM
ncbi:sulfite exporter TauE/SafE family protein, partial [Acinetobacter wuhouensis]|uniref:sulfite exporter TauE/SafE family protein n=2 Tax=Acinetobacter TaxID=469 RepID=UPI001022B3D2